MAAFKQALVPFGEVLAAAVVHLAVDAAGNVQRHRPVQRGDAEFLGDEVQALHRNEPAEHQLIALAVGGGPHHPADRLAVFQVEGPVIGFHLAGQQTEAHPVQPQIQPGDVGGVGQLGHLVVIEFVEGACHKQIPLFTGVELIGGVAQAEIAVALAHDRLAFAQMLGIKGVFCYDPVRCAGIIHTHKSSSLYGFAPFGTKTFLIPGQKIARPAGTYGAAPGKSVIEIVVGDPCHDHQPA